MLTKHKVQTSLVQQNLIVDFALVLRQCLKVMAFMPSENCTSAVIKCQAQRAHSRKRELSHDASALRSKYSHNECTLRYLDAIHARLLNRWWWILLVQN